jgi:hypothetical protein
LPCSFHPRPSQYRPLAFTTRNITQVLLGLV